MCDELAMATLLILAVWKLSLMCGTCIQAQRDERERYENERMPRAIVVTYRG